MRQTKFGIILKDRQDEMIIPSALFQKFLRLVKESDINTVRRRIPGVKSGYIFTVS